MAPRQDLISSAVDFLRDPSVASSPIEKRIEFLKSKNLTQEEIDLALSQTDGSSPSRSPNTPFYPPSQQQQYQRPPPGYDYGYGPYGPWQQAPPEPPKRDWRDWFIMATVVGGASYGMYVLAQRYIKPLIAPPTPAQLEQDKAAIDEQFTKAFALLDTLSQDTDALKKAEEARTARLDTAIGDIETIVAELKAASVRRDDDARRMEAEVKSMKDGLPRAIDTVREGSERQLKDLSTELASLKALMSNRMGSTTNSMFNAAGPAGLNTRQQDLNTASGARNNTPATNNNNNNIATPLALSEVTPGSKGNVTGVNGVATAPSFATPNSSSYPLPTGHGPVASSSSSSAGVPKVPSSSLSSSSSSSTMPTKSASIPAWQMAAQNKASSGAVAPPASSSSSTNTGTTPGPQNDGADAVAALMNSSSAS